MNIAKILILSGVLLIAAGLLWPFFQKIGLGRLPGDVSIQGKNFSIYFPIATCIVISLLISLVLWLIRR